MISEPFSQVSCCQVYPLSKTIITEFSISFPKLPLFLLSLLWETFIGGPLA